MQPADRYTLLGKLATGGMAEVFLARLSGDAGFERQVVIKRVLPQYANDPAFLRLFEQEARFSSLLSHPNVASVSDFGVDASGAGFLVMEYVEGASLRTLLTETARRDERPDARLMARIFSQVAEGLAAVHGTHDPVTGRSLELLHRDVSPENVLLSRQGAVKLADFGIARAVSEVSTTNPDTVRGKLRYLAPEQLLGEPLSPATDVWALGVSLYEALALRRPFPEENEGRTLHSIVTGTFVALEEVRTDLPPELLAVVRRCLQLEPSARFPDCDDLALQLQRVATAEGGQQTARVIGNWVERLAPPRKLLPVDRPLELHSPPSQRQGARSDAGQPAARFSRSGELSLEPSTDDAPLELDTGAPTRLHAPSRFGEPTLKAPAPPSSTGTGDTAAQAWPFERTLEPAPAHEAPLELAVPRAPEPQPEVAAVKSGPRVAVVLAGLAALVLLGVGLGGLAQVRKSRAPPTHRQVLVTSTPAGATVRAGQDVLGQTPWAGDLSASQVVELIISAPGFSPAHHTLQPGDIAPVNVTLQRAR